MDGIEDRLIDPILAGNFNYSIPNSPLEFKMDVIDRDKFRILNQNWHSRLPECRNCFEGICFALHHNSIIFAVAWWSKPIAQNRLKNGKYIYELRRMAIYQDAPFNTASRFLSLMSKFIKAKFPNIYKLISYQDTEVHYGTIYKASNWKMVDNQNKFLSWKNRKDYKRIDQSCAKKIRWELEIRKLKSTVEKKHQNGHQQIEMF